jgi:predicted nucleic acid-binding protein
LVSDPDTDLHVPALCDVEIASALRRLRTSRLLSERRRNAALSDYVDLPLTRHGHLALLARVLHLGANFSAYDGVYVALADGLEADLVTGDARLARAVEAHTDVTLV